MTERNSDTSLDTLPGIRRMCIVVGSIATALVLSSFVAYADRDGITGTYVDPIFAEEAGYPPIPTITHLNVLEEIDLEHAFWECDHTATRYGVDATDPVRCQAIYDTLKRLNFGGDFDALVGWWQVNRDAQYARLDRIAHPN